MFWFYFASIPGERSIPWIVTNPRSLKARPTIPSPQPKSKTLVVTNKQLIIHQCHKVAVWQWSNQIDIWLWGLYTWYLLETEPTLQFFLLPSKISKTLSKHEDWVKTVSCLFFWCLMNHQNMKIILLPAYYIPTLSLLPHSSLPSEGPQT